MGISYSDMQRLRDIWSIFEIFVYLNLFCKWKWTWSEQTFTLGLTVPEYSNNVSWIDDLLPSTGFSNVSQIVSMLSNIAASSSAIVEPTFTMCCKCWSNWSNYRMQKSRLSWSILLLFLICLKVLDVIFLNKLSNSSEYDVLFVILKL